MALQLKDNRISRIYSLSRRAFWHYKWQISVLVVLGFLSGALEGIGVNALIPLFSFMAGTERGNDNFITKYIQDLFNFAHIDFSLKFLLIFMVCLFIVKAIIILIFSYVRIRIHTDYEETTRNSLFKSVLNAKWPYLLKQKIGHMDTLLMTDISHSSILLREISNMIMIFTGLIMYILVAINISFVITLITLALGGILFLLFKPLLYKTCMYATLTSSENKEVAHYVNESVLGMKTIKSMHIIDKIAQKGAVYFNELKQFKKITYLLNTVSSALLQPISLIFISIVFAISYKIPEFNFAALIAIIYLIQRIFQYIQSLQSNLHTINESVPYLKNVLDYQQEASEQYEQEKGSNDFNFKESLEFKNACFRYNEKQPVLSNVNFAIARGEMVGLVGESGSGKTTIVDLLLRLFDLGSGEILLDNGNISDISLKQWRRNIGYVSQDVFLINDTIANNINFFDTTIRQKDIEQAAKMANIYGFIQKCPDGFNTVVGERGIMLSGGQRQRIAIARVLARKPKLLILDEATSSLDNESEARIQEVIEKLHRKVTVLVVAHRLSTVMNADKLIILENGKITEQGSPKDLLDDKKTYFHKLATMHQ